MLMKNGDFTPDSHSVSFEGRPDWGKGKSNDHFHRSNDPRKTEGYDLSNFQGNQ